MGLRQLSDLSSNSAHIILSSSNTAFSEELNTPDLRFSAGTGGQDNLEFMVMVTLQLVIQIY